MHQHLDEVRLSPADAGTVELVVRRPGEGEREVLEEAELDPEAGLVGDRWRAGNADRDMQLTLMNARSAAAIAGDRDNWAIAGDQLYVDFDLSAANLPPGTRLRVGEATIEVTDEPHLGCGKFSARFGVDMLKLVNSKVGRELNMRGINARVVTGGVVRPGDEIVKA